MTLFKKEKSQTKFIKVNNIMLSYNNGPDMKVFMVIIPFSQIMPVAGIKACFSVYFNLRFFYTEMYVLYFLQY